MSTPNNDQQQPDKMESLKPQAPACGPGCNCQGPATAGKTRWVIGAIVLIAAGVLVVRGMVKSGKTQAAAAGYASPVAIENTANQSVAATNSSVAAPASETSVGTTIGAFAELNTVAANTDAVFIFLPGKESAAGNAASAPMKKAAQTMESKGVKCGLFTLKAGSTDYQQIAAQMAVPGVLAVVKGRGMSAVSGEITESKLLQGYVSASSAGGCGPSAGSACCPK